MSLNRTTVEQPSRSNSYRLHEFDPTSYGWDDWEILFNTYVDVEGITDDKKKRNFLITSLDVQPFKTLIFVCKPKKPTDYTYHEIIQKLRTNYARITFPSTERIKFFAARQETSQTLTDFANLFRDKTVTCHFPNDFYEDALITAFVSGLKNEHVRKYLMQQNLETFEQTLNAAKIFESVLIQGTNVKNDLSEELSVLKIGKSNKHYKNVDRKPICSSCGSTNHPRSQCYFRHVVCHKCHKKGHITKACRSQAIPNRNKINIVFSLQHEQVTNDHPIQIPVRIDGLSVTFQLDTGSPITIINEHTWKKMGKPPLKPVTSTYSSFSGHSIPLKGERMVKVIYDGHDVQLQMLVGVANRTNILGRNWINALHLNKSTLDNIINHNKVLSVNSNIGNLNVLINKYKEIFKEGLGFCKIKAHLYVKPDTKPKFYKPRSLPFAYRQAVEMDLDRLVSDGVLKPVNIAKWAAPIVVVPKPGGKVRICADFSTGVNQALDIDRYSLPKPNDLFVALNGGSQFSKIDFSEAYLQVELDDESKQLLIINTHKGLFQFNCLPFGIASAPSIFQKIMDQMLSGLEGTVSYLDDIIVTGKNKFDHLHHLDKVFSRIKEYGFHISKSKCKFLQDNVEYLGFIVDKHGVHSSPSKIKAIIDMPKPTNVSKLRSFLGMVNHYAKFIPKLTDRLIPFYSLLKKDTSWIWTSACDNAFKNVKKFLTSPLALTHYDPSLPLVLAADASNTGVGAVIYHRYPDGKEKAIAHCAKK